MQRYSSRLVPHARGLRRRATEAEQLLWRHLRAKQIRGLRFYRQRPLLGYVVDFYCPQARLVVEVDGGQHFHDEGRRSDRARDARLRYAGLDVLRFDNRQVLVDTDSVLETIRLFVDRRLEESPSSSPFPEDGQGGEQEEGASCVEDGQGRKQDS